MYQLLCTTSDFGGGFKKFKSLVLLRSDGLRWDLNCRKTKDKKSICRSRQIIVVNKCGLGHEQVNCKQKQPVPEEKVRKFAPFFLSMIFLCKIYEEKTIEVGVYIDRHLYKNMEEVLKSFLLFNMIYHIIYEKDGPQSLKKLVWPKLGFCPNRLDRIPTLAKEN